MTTAAQRVTILHGQLARAAERRSTAKAAVARLEAQLEAAEIELDRAEREHDRLKMRAAQMNQPPRRTT